MVAGSRVPRASTSATTAKSSSKKRGKRAEEDQEEEIKIPDVVLDTLGLTPGGELRFESEDEDNDDDDIIELEGEGGDDEEAFPEIEFGDEEDDEDFSEELEFDGDEDDEDDSDDSSLGLVDPEEEAALLAEIEAEDALSDEEASDPIGRFIQQNSTKPNEAEDSSTVYEDPALLRDYMRRAKTVISDITGVEKTEWEHEIDAGYGSDSSTEEVSRDFSLLGCQILTFSILRRRIESEMCQLISMTTCRILVTTLMERK
jgi:ribosome biogenesis protein ERB1